MLRRLERQLRDRDERIALLEEQLERRDEDMAVEARRLLLEITGGDGRTEEEAVVPSPVAPLQLRPQLASRLSASGTDFSAFSVKHRRRSSQLGAVRGDVPTGSSDSPLGKAEGESVLSPVPKPAPAIGSPGLGNKKVHLNDVTSLAVKTRRQQGRNTVLAMTASADNDEDDEDEQVYDREVAAVASIPSSSPPPSANTVFEPQEAQSPAPSPSPKPFSQRTSERAGSCATLTRAAVLPSETVRAALGERTLTVGPGSLAAPTGGGDSRKRSATGGIFKLFVSSFPKKSPVMATLGPGASLESSGPIVVAADGGFQAHQACFAGKPLFGASSGHVIESYAGDGAWTFAASSLSVPGCFRLSLADRRFETPVRPRVWGWEKGGLVVVAQVLGGDTGECVLVRCGGQGFVKSVVQVPNVSVMSGRELSRVLLRAAGPEASEEDRVRIKGAALEQLWPRLIELEQIHVRRVFDVDYCDVSAVTAVGMAMAGAAETGKKTRRASLTGSRGGKAASVLHVLAQQSEAGHAHGDVVSYAWNDVEIRLHVVRSLTQCTHEVVVCAVEDSASIVVPSAASPCVKVLLAVRESAQQRYEVACCSRRDVPPFGPPFFQQPLKDKTLQSVVTAKILHAFDTVAPDSSPARSDSVRSLIRSVSTANKI